MPRERGLIPVEKIEPSILLIRGQRVMLDSDLAEIYGVTTKRLDEQVRRNIERFPDDFSFLLAPQDVVILRSQIATSNELDFLDHVAVLNRK